MNKQTIDIINSIKEIAGKVMPLNSEVMLYGSRARNEARNDSDWDLLILLDKDKIEQSDYDDIAYSFTYLGWQLGQTIIPVMYTKKQWQALSFMPFYKNVEKDKISLL